MAFPRVNTIKVIRITPRRLMINPVLTISVMRMRSVPNIMALGGVATGSIKAQEHDSVAGIIRNRGFILMAIASAPRIGKSISDVAVFDVNSVRNVTKRQIIATIRIGCKEPIPES